MFISKLESIQNHKNKLFIMMIKLSYIILFPLRLIEPLLDNHTLVIVTGDYGIFMNVF